MKIVLSLKKVCDGAAQEARHGWTEVASTPMSPSINIMRDKTSVSVKEKRYRGIISGLSYLIVSCSNILFLYLCLCT